MGPAKQLIQIRTEPNEPDQKIQSQSHKSSVICIISSVRTVAKKQLHRV